MSTKYGDLERVIKALEARIVVLEGGFVPGAMLADGSVPMEGDLDLDGNSLANVADIAADGDIGFNGATPTGQGAAIADPTGAATDQDDEARAAIDDILAYLRLRGDIAT